MDNDQQNLQEGMRLDGLLGSQADAEPAKRDRSWFPWAMALGTFTAIIVALLTMM